MDMDQGEAFEAVVFDGFTRLRTVAGDDVVAIGLTSNGEESFIALPRPQLRQLLKAADRASVTMADAEPIHWWTMLHDDQGRVILGLRTAEGTQKFYSLATDDPRAFAEKVVDALRAVSPDKTNSSSNE